MSHLAAPGRPGEEPEGKTDPLRDDVSVLWARVRAGEAEARRRMVEDNLALVTALVRRMGPAPDEYDDCLQVGCIGLLKAVDGFDPGFGVRFSTYAVPVILGELRQFARGRHPMKQGRTLQDKARAAARARDELSQQFGREPTVSEVARKLGVDPEDVVLALEAGRPVASLEAPVGSEKTDAVALGDMLAAASPVPGEAETVNMLLLRQALDRLAPWERRLIGLRYFADKSQTEVARLLGVSQAHVSRTERRILTRFRELFNV